MRSFVWFALLSPSTKLARRRVRVKDIFGTYNNYTDDELNRFKAEFSTVGPDGARALRVGYRYVAAQLERGGLRNTPHIQFVYGLPDPVDVDREADRLEAVLGRRPHLEAARDPFDAWGYCRDPRKRDGDSPAAGDVFELGDRPTARGGQGRRSDLAQVAEAVLSGSSLTDVAQQFPSTYVRNYRGLADLSNRVRPVRQRRCGPVVRVHHGASGTGKSLSVLLLSEGLCRLQEGVVSDRGAAFARTFEPEAWLDQVLPLWGDRPRPAEALEDHVHDGLDWRGAGPRPLWYRRVTDDLVSDEAWQQIYWHPGGRWYDGYDPHVHKIVVFDEFDPLTMTWAQFKQIINWTPLRVERKGGVIEFCSPYVVFTLNSIFGLYATERSMPEEESVWNNRVSGVWRFEQSTVTRQ